MHRRAFIKQSLPALALMGTAPAIFAEEGARDFGEARERFLALSGTKSFAILLGRHPWTWWDAYCPTLPMFVGSATKTFILARFLQGVESGALSENELLLVSDAVRSLSSSVFGSSPDDDDNLTGKASARTVLEAMISHSDNTATDMALRCVGVEQVRAFIASTGLHATRIPDSTRVMFSYLAGAPDGIDEGWEGMKEILGGAFFGSPRSPINDRQTMISSASEMVSYYRRALCGEFFCKPETLTEFKRIQAMASLIARVVPSDTAAYAKGGSIDWEGFHAVCAPGQMVVNGTPVTFCFTVNWTGPDSSVPEVLSEFAASVAEMLGSFAKPRNGSRKDWPLANVE